MNYTNNNEPKHTNAWNQLVECIRQNHFRGGQFLLKICSVSPHELLTKRIPMTDGNSTRNNGGEQRQRHRVLLRNDPSHVAHHHHYHRDKRTKELNSDINSPRCNILHLACKCRIPVEALRLLLHHCSKARHSKGSYDSTSVLQHFVNEQDDLGWTSLHYAVLYGCSEDTILKLIEAGGEGNNHAAVTLPNNVGWTPLHLACRHGTTTKIIKAMLHVDSSGVGALRSTTITETKNDNHSSSSPNQNNAMHILWNSMNRTKNHQRCLQSILFQASSSETSTATVTRTTGQWLKIEQKMKQDYPQLHDMWEQMICLILSTSTSASSLSFKKNTLLHVAIPLLLQKKLPIEVLKLATILYPHLLYERVCHHQGRIPLHLILSNRENIRGVTVASTSNVHDKSHLDTILQLFVTLAPQTARIVDPKSGRFPLHMAIDLGLSWKHERQENLLMDGPSTKFAVIIWRNVLEARRQRQHGAVAADVNGEIILDKGGLEWLIHAAPEILHEVDTPTQLLPAFLSASIEQSSFETTFRLLQHCPSQVVIV